MEVVIYDYAIIGAGAAGLQLALRMMEDDHFREKKILILDKDPKSGNDRTWCFWEKENGRWDRILHHQWEMAQFNTHEFSRQYDLHPYRYKMIRGIDFYNFARSETNKTENVTWICADVVSLQEGETVSIIGREQRFRARQVFDSRIEPAFYKENKYTRILQHFKGWVIHTPTHIFDPRVFTMMDFRLKWKGSASFTYVLPFSENQALVEFTLFTPKLIAEEEYDKMLACYLKDYLGLGSYSVVEKEYGVIPMTDFPFQRNQSHHITKIGTAGGWVKPSSGYSFKNCEKYTGQIVESIKKGESPSDNLVPRRFRFYDRIFLDVLNKRNDLGEQIFTSMYTQNSIQEIFKFLDNETGILEEMKIIKSFEPLPFLHSLFRQIIR